MNRGFVAQVSNLLYRRLPVGSSSERLGVGGLEIRDTADWKSALPQVRVSGSWCLSMSRPILLLILILLLLHPGS